MSHHIRIEWRHYDKEGLTCSRCNATGANLQQVVDECRARGITVELQETLLPYDRISESNLVLINGLPLEELLADAAVGESECPSCGCLSGQATQCRTMECDGETFEELTPELLRRGIEAILAA